MYTMLVLEYNLYVMYLIQAGSLIKFVCDVLITRWFPGTACMWHTTSWFSYTTCMRCTIPQAGSQIQFHCGILPQAGSLINFCMWFTYHMLVSWSILLSMYLPWAGSWSNLYVMYLPQAGSLIQLLSDGCAVNEQFAPMLPSPVGLYLLCCLCSMASLRAQPHLIPGTIKPAFSYT